MLVKMRKNSRKLLAITSCILAGFVSVSSYAFTLGDIRLDSALNQPLDAEIQLLELDGLDPSQILVSLGSQADFQRVGVDPLPLLNELEFEVEVLSGELGLIHISSPDAIVEPYLNFVLNVRWPSGRVIREYTVLLDLPTFSANPVPAPAPAETAPAPRPQAVTPTPPAPTPTPAPQVAQEPEPEPAPERQLPEPTTTNTAGETVVIQPGDSMWNIALATRPDNSVSVQQMMVAIQRANTGSDAFINNNINGIRAGRVLRIPDRQEIAAIGQQQALNQVALQNQQFSGGQPLAVNTTQGGVDNNRDELSIITGSEPADSQQVSGLNDTIRMLENELAISEESLDAARLENEELSSRLEDLEEQIGILENIIAIEDQRMAELQAQLAEQQNDAQTADTNVLAVNDTAQPPPPQSTPEPAPPAPQTTSEPASDNPAIVTPRISNFLNSTVGMGLALLVLLALVVGFLVARNKRSMQDDDEFDPNLEDEEEFAADEFDEDLNNTADSATDESATPAFSDIDELDDGDDSDESNVDDERSFNDDSEDDDYADADVDEDSVEGDYDSLDEEGEPQEKTGFLAGLLARFSRKKSAEDDYDEDEEYGEEYGEEYEDDEDLELNEPESDDGADGDFTADAEEDDEQALMPDGIDEIDEPSDEQLPEEEDIEVDELLANSPEVKDAEQDELLNLEADEAEGDAETAEADLSATEQGQETEDDELDIEFTDLDDDSGNAVTDDVLETSEDSEAETKADTADTADEAEEVFEFSLDDNAEAGEDAEAQEPPPNDLESLEFAVDDEPSTEAETDTATATEEEPDDDLETFDFGKISLDEPAGDNAEDAAAETESDEVEEIEFLDEAETTDSSQDGEKTNSSLGKLGIGDTLLDDDSDEEELEMITDQDEVATKLDLAVAYQAMEDLEGAREILQEVIAEGNDEQIAEAKRLLEEWGDS